MNDKLLKEILFSRFYFKINLSTVLVSLLADQRYGIFVHFFITSFINLHLHFLNYIIDKPNLVSEVDL